MKTTSYSPCIFVLFCVIYLVHATPQPLRKTGHECDPDGKCSPVNSHCFEGRWCDCIDRYIRVPTSKTTFICVKEASYVDDECFYDIQCSAALGTHAECKKKPGDSEQTAGRCDCKGDSHFQDGICYNNSRIGESCKVNDNCVIINKELRAYCDHGRCVCPPYYHPNENGTDCLPSSDLQGPCISDEDCIIMNAKCERVCVCKMGFVMSNRRNRCLLAADKLHSPCDEDAQCTEFLPSTRCDPISARCNCTLDTHEVNGACYKSSRLHEPCKKTEECLIDSRNISRVQCNQGFCFCAKDYEMIDRADCVDMKRSLPDKSGANSKLEIKVFLLLFMFLSVSQLI